MINQIEPWITQAEVNEITNCIQSTFVTEGMYTDLFEVEIQRLHKLKYQPVAFCNATAALYSSLLILGIKKNDYVIIPATTFIATANAVIMAGGIPVCVDVDESFNMKLDLIEKNICEKTFAIMPVHLYGHCTNINEIRDLCDKYHLHMIEDASQGVGVVNEYGTYAGSIGDISVLSFYGNKFITSAQGGMVVSDNIDYLEKAKRIKNHGRSSKGTFFHEDIGFNFCTSDLHSALGYSQLKRFEEIRLRKLEIYSRYAKNLSINKHISIDTIISKKPAYWFISILYADIEKLQTELLKSGIQTRRAFPPLSSQPCYSKSNKIVFHSDEGAKKIYNTYLSLPSSATLTNDEIDYISNKINDITLSR